MMRIVDVCAFWSPLGGGVRTYVARKLGKARSGVKEVVVVAPWGSTGELEHAVGGRIVTLKGPVFPLDRRYRYFRDEQALHDLLDHLAPDVVEVSSPWWSASMVARWRGSAVRSLVMHADPLSAYAYRWFGGVASRQTIDRGFEWFWRHLRSLDREFDIIVSASENLTGRLIAGGLGKVQTIPMGVDPGLFSPRLRDERLRSQLLAACGLNSDATLLLGIGRHAPEKRWPMVIDAVTAAANSRPIGFVLLGDGRDRASVVRAASNNPHIHLLAPISDRRTVATILASADALVHGCEAETFCITAAEAKASGIPLIVPNEGGAADQFLIGAGLRYKAGSAASLAETIERFVASGPCQHREIAIGAAAGVPSMDQHMDQLFAAYRSACMARTDYGRAA
jgi:alpha-1,6-mannosyltransferase